MWKSASSPFGTSTAWCPQLQSIHIFRPEKLRRYQKDEDLVWKAEGDRGKSKCAAPREGLKLPKSSLVKETWQWNFDSELFLRID